MLIEIEPKLKVTLEEFKVLELIGKGQFGEVFCVLYQNEKYAMKRIMKQTLLKSGKVNSANLELKIMYSLEHENIMRLHTHFEDIDYVYLILEYIDGPNLYTLLQRDTRIQEATTIFYFRQIVNTLIYLHTRQTPILHRDIKPENILITKKNAIKLADFGSANSLQQGELRFTFEGTPLFMAPEIYLNQGYTQSVDIWSLGVLLFEVLAGHSPFLLKDNKLPFQQQRELIKENILNIKIHFPDTFPPLARDLIRKMLTFNPNERLPLLEILKHPWFASFSENVPILFIQKEPIDPKEVCERIANQTKKTNSNQFQKIVELKKSINETQIQILKGEMEKQTYQNKLKELQQVNEDESESPAIVSPEKIVHIEEKYNKLKSEINELQKQIIDNNAYISKNQMHVQKMNHYKNKITKQKEVIEKLERELISLNQRKIQEQHNQDKELQQFTQLNNSRNIETIDKKQNEQSQYSMILRDTIERFKELMNLYKNLKQDQPEMVSPDQAEWKKEYLIMKKSLQEDLKHEEILLKKLQYDNQQLKIRIGQITAHEQQIQKAEQIVANLEYGCKLKKDRIEELQKQKHEYMEKIENYTKYIQYSQSP